MATPPPPQFPSYPLFLRLAGAHVLLVGGGSVALRKTRGLVECGARVTVVSPQFVVGFDKFAGVEQIVSSYAADHIGLQTWRLVFAATDDAAVNEQVGSDAVTAGILCCRCDEPEEGDFSGGAVKRLGDKSVGVTLAISTAGASPVIATRIRDQAAAAIDPVLIQLADLLSAWRARVKVEVTDPAIRRALLERLAGAEMEKILRSEGVPAAQRLFEEWLPVALTATPEPTKMVNHAL